MRGSPITIENIMPIVLGISYLLSWFYLPSNFLYVVMGGGAIWAIIGIIIKIIQLPTKDSMGRYRNDNHVISSRQAYSGYAAVALAAVLFVLPHTDFSLFPLLSPLIAKASISGVALFTLTGHGIGYVLSR
jgi:hypothetical protein